ncbi:hypothetical protein ABZP36_014682 [Zizania latifolia]
MMLDSAIFDEGNPIWDWLNKCTSEVGTSLDETYLSLSRNFSSGISSGNKKEKRTRVDEEIEFKKSEDRDKENEFEDVSSGSKDNSGHGVSIDELSDGDDDEQDIETSPRVEEDNFIHGKSYGL